MSSKNDLSDQELLKAAREFLNETINSQLRIKITQDNQKIREFVVARALFSNLGQEESGGLDLSLAGGNDAQASWEDDPLGITQTWEEKNEKKKKAKKK